MQQIPLEIKHQVILWYLLQHSSRSFNKLLQYFNNAEAATHLSALPTWRQLNLHKNHLERFEHYHSPQGQSDFAKLWENILTNTSQILDKAHPAYPPLLLHFEESPPLLFVQGDYQLLAHPQIAIVGSRKPSVHGNKTAYDFADYFSAKNYITTSGLALGIDTAAHQGAIRTGQTIAVIETGLEQCYPKSNLGLFKNILETGGCIVTQFLPFTPPIKINFPKRNYLISGMSLGTLVVEAGLNSGSLITAKAAAEQGRQVFAIPGHIYSPHHQGCHQLIREGATLVDHPEQIIEDLLMFHANTPTITLATDQSKPQLSMVNTSNPSDLPEHLQNIYQLLDWSGVSLDFLAQQSTLDVSELNIVLMELELLGYCKSHAGRYIRCS